MGTVTNLKIWILSYSIGLSKCQINCRQLKNYHLEAIRIIITITLVLLVLTILAIQQTRILPDVELHPQSTQEPDSGELMHLVLMILDRLLRYSTLRYSVTLRYSTYNIRSTHIDVST